MFLPKKRRSKSTEGIEAPGLRRSGRETRPPDKLKGFVLFSLASKPANIPPPKTLGEAKNSAWWPGYEKAIQAELDQLEKLECWDLVPKKSNFFLATFARVLI